MFPAQITFSSDIEKSHQLDVLENIVEGYLVTLLRNGQIYGDHVLGWSAGNLVVYVYIAQPNSLEEQYHSQWGKSNLDSLIKSFGQPPKCQIIDDCAPKPSPSWKLSTSFYLFTHAFDNTSPLCCGDTSSAIPIYMLPISDQTRDDLYGWARSYSYHDNIWLDSDALEIPAYKQLADPKSDLSLIGRKLCADVEQAIGKPTFYYLHRYWGRNSGEAVRSCPLCNGKWHLFNDLVDRKAFHKFHFCCKRCRLVSHCATSYDDERHARIGEFKKATQ